MNMKRKFRRVTLRLPEDEAVRVTGALKEHNKRLRVENRISLNDWLVAASRSTLDVAIIDDKVEAINVEARKPRMTLEQQFPQMKKPEREYVYEPAPEAKAFAEQFRARRREAEQVAQPAPALDVDKLKQARTAAELAAAIPGLRLGLPDIEEDEAW